MNYLFILFERAKAGVFPEASGRLIIPISKDRGLLAWIGKDNSWEFIVLWVGIGGLLVVLKVFVFLRFCVRFVGLLAGIILLLLMHEEVSGHCQHFAHNSHQSRARLSTALHQTL